MQSSNEMPARYGIEELAEKGGVSRRTVRYYVQRGLLPAPTGTGRGQHYTEEHLQTLIRIRQFQEANVPLSEIPGRLSGQLPRSPAQSVPLNPPSWNLPHPGPTPPMVPMPQPPVWPPSPGPWETSPSQWTRIVLSDGVELHLRGRFEAAIANRIAEAVRHVLGTQNPTC